MNNLITKINEWAISHGLDKGNPKVEWMKVTEEVGEIRDRQGVMIDDNFIKTKARQPANDSDNPTTGVASN